MLTSVVPRCLPGGMSKHMSWGITMIFCTCPKSDERIGTGAYFCHKAHWTECRSWTHKKRKPLLLCAQTETTQHYDSMPTDALNLDALPYHHHLASVGRLSR
ncbi:hypothetical protein AcV7_001899 [Taiwanofungus camphoratus]|nr:hypothetical protein AcV7_001899 [Antrodia cinnamomea]